MNLPTASEIARDVATGARTATSVLAECLNRVAIVDPQVKAFVRLHDQAHEVAARVDRAVEEGTDPGPLAGVPIALKDNLALAGERLTCGSKILENYVSPFSATAVERLVQAGAVPIGHTNMDEFGMGSSTENSAHFVTRNPWDADRVPGGSSGGSAAAVASGCVPVALGSDTGGSIRQPAALCGVVGLKPSYGRVSRFGLVAFASSLDQIGPMTRSIEDAALVQSAIAGFDPMDATSARGQLDALQPLADEGARGLKVGIVRQFVSGEQAEGLDGCVRRNWSTMAEALAAAGAEIVEVDLPSSHAAIATYYVLANSEASANLSRFDGVRYGQRAATSTLDELYEQSRSAGFGPEVKRRILLGTFALSSGYYDAYYGKAVAVAGQLKTELAAALSKCDVLMTPTSPTSAFPIGERTQDPLAMYLSDTFTTLASLSGLPAVAVPSGVDRNGLPLSMQLIGRRFEEGKVLRGARAVEATVEPLAVPELFLEEA